MEELAKLNSVNITELKITKQGNNGGTYLHPELVVHFARWCSPKFAIECDRFIKHEMMRVSEIREQAIREDAQKQIAKVKAFMV